MRGTEVFVGVCVFSYRWDLMDTPEKTQRGNKARTHTQEIFKGKITGQHEPLFWLKWSRLGFKAWAIFWSLWNCAGCSKNENITSPQKKNWLWKAKTAAAQPYWDCWTFLGWNLVAQESITDDSFLLPLALFLLFLLLFFLSRSYTYC